MRTEKKIIKRILFKKGDIKRKIKILSTKLNEIYKNTDEKVVVFIILKGGMFFASDLLKELNFDLEINFLTSKSYYKKTKVLANPKQEFSFKKEDIENKKIIIIDDVLDTGDTIDRLSKKMLEFKPKNLRLVFLITKNIYNTKLDLNYCFEVDKKYFLLGYGLDYDEKYRNLPYIAII